MPTTAPKTAVILMTMGDAPTVPGVLPFLLRLFSDPAIIRAPWYVRFPLSVVITMKKLGTMRKRYAAIGGGSPMNAITFRQADALERALGPGYKCYVANRYCAPDTADAYRRAKADGAGRIIALPLYPHYSTATTGSNFDALKELVAKDASAPPVVWIRSFADEPGFVAAFSRKVLEALAEFQEDDRSDVQVLFSAHSLPHEFIASGDPYLEEIQKHLAGALRLVKPVYFHLCFQSKGGGRREWLKPETDTVLRELAAKGRDKVVLVPISFVAENIETLYDVEIGYRALANSLGIKKFVRARCLDDDPEFIAVLAGLVRKNM